MAVNFTLEIELFQDKQLFIVYCDILNGMLNKNKKNIGLKGKRIKTLNIFLINSKVAIVVPYIELYGINKEGGAKE
ncbi:hypothetical protein AAHB63_11275 [Bacillus thuringiensis]